MFDRFDACSALSFSLLCVVASWKKIKPALPTICKQEGSMSIRYSHPAILALNYNNLTALALSQVTPELSPFAPFPD